MKNFIIQFDEKVGSTPLVSILENFKKISIVRQNSGEWEPFERFNCDKMRLRSQLKCFDLVYSGDASEQTRLNQLYMKSATIPLVDFNREASIGFKMRFAPLFRVWNLFRWTRSRLVIRLVKALYVRMYEQKLYDFLKRNNIVVFIVVRQDIFRWALSKYHGGGGLGFRHPQFALAKGEINRDDLTKITVDMDQFEQMVDFCQARNAEKFLSYYKLKNMGVEVVPLLYEDFVEDKFSYFERVCKILEIDVSHDEINEALSKGTQFKKVHSDDISSFVLNHEELVARYGDRFTRWYY